MGHPIWFGFDLDWDGFVEGVVAEAAPWIVFGFRDQASGDRVAVDVAELLDVFGVALNVKIVVAGEPEMFLARELEIAGSGLFEDLKDPSEESIQRLVGEEVDVLRHEDIGGYLQGVAVAGLLENFEKYFLCLGCCKKRETVVTTKGDEVEVAGVLSTLQAWGHGGSISCFSRMGKE